MRYVVSLLFIVGGLGMVELFPYDHTSSIENIATNCSGLFLIFIGNDILRE